MYNLAGNQCHAIGDPRRGGAAVIVWANITN